MATSPTKTIKISQTIRLDLEYSKVESVRIVDVDLLIVLKDGQRLVVPEGAVRAMMDPDFSINFKGRTFSVASLMELQTFETRRVTEVGIVQSPALPDKPEGPGTRDVSRVDLTQDASADAQPQDAPAPTTQAAQAAAPARASTEATAQARQAASELDRQADLKANANPATPEAESRSGRAATASTEALTTASAVKTTDAATPSQPSPADSASAAPAAGLSPLWKYAVGALGAGVAALATRVGAKAVEPLLTDTPVPGSFLSLDGAIALGPITASQVRLRVLGRDASGKTILLSGDGDLTKDPNAGRQLVKVTNGTYKISLNVKTYTGPVVVELTDGSDGADYTDETTQQGVDLAGLVLRSSTVINGTSAPSLNITPLTELAVRSALGSKLATSLVAVPASAAAVTQANTAVAQAFGLGPNADVATSTVKTVLDDSFKVDGSVGSKYALALAALSGVDYKQTSGTAAEKVQKTLELFAQDIIPSTPGSTNASLSSASLNTLMTGALNVQPVVQKQVGEAALNVISAIASQVTSAVPSAAKITALVTAPGKTLGQEGQPVRFHFSQAVTNFSASDVQFDAAGYRLSGLKREDTAGKEWSATVVVPPGATGSVKLSLVPTAWVSTSWSWDVDTTAPTAPMLSLGAGSDSGTSAADRVSNVKTPTLRLKLSADAAAGDTLTITQKDKATGNTILGSGATARNEKSVVLTRSDIQKGMIEVAFSDLGVDGNYRFDVTQQDAAGNRANPVQLDYTLDTTAPSAVALKSNNNLVDFGDKTPAGLVNKQAKELGFTLSGTGGVPDGTLSVVWSGKTLDTQGVRIDAGGNWSVQVTKDDVPADGTATKLQVSQLDAAGNASPITEYTVEVSTAGVTAKVLKVEVADNSGAVAAGAYSINAQGNVLAGQSTDDTTPVITVKLDQNLRNTEAIEVYDGVITAASKPVLVLTGLAQSLENGQFVWRSTDADWAAARSLLSVGPHTLSARVVNTRTLDVGTEVPEAGRPAFVVQGLDFTQLSLSADKDGNPDPARNQIPDHQSAGLTPITDIPVNKPVLGGTLATALAAGERLAVYDVVGGVESFLGRATLTPVRDSSNVPTGAYTWQFTPATALSNGQHQLNVRLETDNATPVVRMAMSQDVSVAIPILSISPASVSPNGVSTDTGSSSTDGKSSSRTPWLRFAFPKTGRVVGDEVKIYEKGNNALPLTSITLEQDHINAGMIDFSVSIPATNRVYELFAIIEAAPGGVEVPKTEILSYTLDNKPPEPVKLTLTNDTSAGKFTTSNPEITYETPTEKGIVQYQVKRNGVLIQEYSETKPEFLSEGSYSVSARVIDEAGNVGRVAFKTELGPGEGILNFVLDTTGPGILPPPSLQNDTGNGLGNSANDTITTNIRLKDEGANIGEAKARIEYQVTSHSPKGETSEWVGSYFEALWSSNKNAVEMDGLTLDAWLALNSKNPTEAASKLSEGAYTVRRRQKDVAGNAGLPSSFTFTLDTKTTDVVLALVNDTSKGQNKSSDVNVNVDATSLDGVPNVDLRMVYELKRFDTEANWTNNTSPVSTITGSSYTPPTTDGYYRLTVTQTNKAGLSSSASLNFQRDTVASAPPTAAAIASTSDTTRGNDSTDNSPNTGVNDGISKSTTPTFNITLPTSSGVTAPQPGDRVELYLNGDLSQPWGTVTLTQDYIRAGSAPVQANSLAPAPGQAAGATDRTYRFKARLVDAAGNASDLGSEFTYTLDTVVQTPTIDPIALEGLPTNFINGFVNGDIPRASITLTGTGEPKSRVDITWGSESFKADVNASGRWFYEVPEGEFPSDTARLAFTSEIRVKQTDIAGNVSDEVTLSVALNTAKVTTLAVIDRVSDSNLKSSNATPAPNYAVNPTGVVAPGQTTDEHQPVLTGRLTQPLVSAPDGSYPQELQVWANSAPLGTATVDGLNWTFNVPSALQDARHTFWVVVYDPLTLQSGEPSSGYDIISNQLTLNPLDAAHPDQWLISDTPTPTLSGTIKTALGAGESLAVYVQKADGSFDQVGKVDPANINPSTGYWSFDFTQPQLGVRTYRVQIETSTGTSLMAIDQAVRYDFNSIVLKDGSDTGRDVRDSISRVKTPTVQVYLASGTAEGAVVRLRVDGNLLSDPAYQKALTQQDLSTGYVEFTLPDLTQQRNALGGLTGDKTYRLSASVGSAVTVTDIQYGLDSTPPTLTPAVALSAITGNVGGVDTGFTSDKRLVAITSGKASDPSAYEQVRVVNASGSVVRDWVSVADFNSGSLQDGTYTLQSRIVDVAGNIGLTAGNALTLRLDTQAAEVSGITSYASTAVSTALKQDSYLSKSESEASSVFQFKLSFNEKIKGLTTGNLALQVSGTPSALPTLEGVTALDADANGYTRDWLVSVSRLDHLPQGGALRLVVSNGTGIVDQARNANNSLAYSAGVLLSVDREAAISISAVKKGDDSLLVNSTVPVNLNAAAVAAGVQVSGTVSSVEPGQSVRVSLVDAATNETVYELAPVTVAANGAWTATLVKTPDGAGLGALVDQQRYTLKAVVQDVAGNEAQQSLTVNARLTASIDINTVTAISTGQPVLNFLDDSTDAYVTGEDKSSGTAVGLNGSGIQVSGTTTLEPGRTVTVALQRNGSSASIFGSGGVVDRDGNWTVTFSSTQVRNLADATYTLTASGTDQYGNSATNAARSRSFTVDTLASVNLNTVGTDAKVNLSDDGTSLDVSGTFADVETSHPLTLTLRDRNADDPTRVIWTQDNVVLNADGSWRSSIPLTEWDALGVSKDGNGLAHLVLTASTTDTAGNKAAVASLFSLDRTAPAAPVAGDAIRQIAGDSLEAGSTVSQPRATLSNTAQGVLMAPSAGTPTVSDIASIVVQATSVQASEDQWRLGTTLLPMNSSVTATPLTLGEGSGAIAIQYTFDTTPHQKLVITAASGSFTAAQVQTVLSALAWVNTQTDNTIEQTDRVFQLRYLDAFHNLSEQTTITFQVDTLKPTILSDIVITPSGGVVVDNTINATTTQVSLTAAIGAGQATGGKAEFYVNGFLIGTDTDIGADNTSVSISRGITSPSDWSAAIGGGGAVTVKLYDKAGNHLDQVGPTLIRDVTPPQLRSLTLSASRDGADLSNGASLKAGDVVTVTATYDDTVFGSPTAPPTLTIGSESGVVMTAGVANGSTRTWTYTVSSEAPNSDTGSILVLGDLVSGLADAAGNAVVGNPSVTGTYTADTRPPSAVDVSAAEGTQDSATVYANATSAAEGVLLAAGVQRPDASDTRKITLVLGESVNTNADKLVLGDLELALNADSTPVASGGVAINTVNGLTYSYTEFSKTLEISQHNGSALSADQVQSVVSALKFRNTQGASIAEVDRTATIRYTDMAGNSGTAATVTVKVDTTPPSAVDVSAVGGIQATTTQYLNLANLATASAGVAWASGVQVPSTADTRTITVALSGALDTANDQLMLGDVVLALNDNAESDTPEGVTINGVSGLTYTYTATSKTLEISQQNGSALIPSHVQAVVSALKFKNTQGNNIAEGERTARIRYTDLADNQGTEAVATVVVDLTLPSAVDLLSAAETQSSNTLYVNASAASSGVNLAPDVVAPSTTDTQKIRVVMGGALDTANDTLVLGGRVVSLTADNSDTVPTINSLTNLEYSYTADTKTLVISKQDNTALGGSDVRAIVAALQYKNTSASITEADRTAEISYVNLAGNAGSPGVVTVKVDRTAPVLNSVVLSAKRGSTDLASGASLKADDVVTVTATYNGEVDGVPTTAPTLNIGSESGVVMTADVASGATRTWTYKVSGSEATDTGSISVVASDLRTGVTDAAGNTATGSPSVSGNYIADTRAPTVRSVDILSSTGAQNGLLNNGDTVYLGVTFSEAVVVTGAPTLSVEVGETTVAATLDSGNGTDRLVFKYVVLSDHTDGNGIAVPASALNLPSGDTIRDQAGNDAVLTTSRVSDNPDFKIDNAAPTITAVAIVGADSAGANKTGVLTVGDRIKVTLTTLDPTLVSGSPSVKITLNGVERTATYASGSSSTSLVFFYDIVSGDSVSNTSTDISVDDDVKLAANQLTVPVDASMTDQAGNPLTTSYTQTAQLASGTSISATGLPVATVTGLSFSADTGISDFITKTASQTITINLSEAIAASGEILKLSVDNGATWAYTSTSGLTAASDGKSYTTTSPVTLSGSNRLLARVEKTADATKFSLPKSQAYSIDTVAQNSFALGASVTAKPVLSGLAEAGASVVVELDGDNNGSFETRFNVTADGTGYWAVSTASASTSTGGRFAGFTDLSSSSGANVKVTVTDVALNSATVTRSAPVANVTYTLSNAAVLEGTNGTRTMAFLVTRAGDLSTSGSVSYAIDTALSAVRQGTTVSVPNGDFEGGTNPSYSGVPKNWTPTGNWATVVSRNGSNTMSWSNNTINNSILSDTFAVVANQRYNISWEYSGTVTGGVGMSLDVMSGSSVLTTLDFKTYGTKGLSFTPASSGNVALRFRDTDATSSTVYLDNLTITVDNDYAGAAAGSGSLSFAPGETSKLVTYMVNGDYYKEINDNLIVKLSNPKDASGNDLSANALVKSQGIGVVEEVDVTRMQAIYSLVDVNLGDSITRAIQVRKTSGGTTVVRDIGFDASGNLDLAALQAFYESSDGGAKTAVYVTRWYDQSGKGRDMVQTDTTKQGVIVKAYGSGAYDFGANQLIKRADGSVGISFNNGLNGNAVNTGVTGGGQDDFMSVTDSTLAATNWTDVVISAKVQSTSNFWGTLFQLGSTGSTDRVSAHYPESGELRWDVGTPTDKGRVTGGLVSQGVANDLVFDMHTQLSSAGTQAKNYNDATQAIFLNGAVVATDNDKTASTFSTASTWYLAWHGAGNYYQGAIYSEFSVFLDNSSTTGTYSTPTVLVLRGTNDNDVLSYSGEAGLTTIDGVNGYDVLYLHGAIGFNPDTLSGGMKGIDQIWAVNEVTNTIRLSNAALATNGAPLLLNLDARDQVIVNTISYSFDDTSLQNLYLGTIGNDTLQSTGGNDRIVGRGGVDTYVWLNNQSGTDRIDGFDTTNGSQLDLTALLKGAGYSGSDLSNWLSVTSDGSDTRLEIDLDGTGSGTAKQVIVLSGMSTPVYSTAQEWVDHNLLKVI